MMMENYSQISSSENNQIKLLEKLNAKKYRQEFQQFMVENLTIISDALKDGHDFEALFVTEEFAAKHRDRLEYLQNNSQSSDFFMIGPKLNKQYSNLDTPSGITAIYKIKARELDESSIIYLNGISDPGNLGTIMRSALAFGFINLVLDESCVDVYNSKVIAAAKDAIFKLNIIEDKTGEWLKNNKLPIYATSSHEGVNLTEFKPAKAFCLVLGSESHGVSPEIMKLAKTNLKIEMSENIESLNVATAAAILLYELKRK
ncbi:MAG: RNA methyltransferase [Patescibacteria group bacterium]|jgi:TrmH family RNA methyltransferase